MVLEIPNKILGQRDVRETSNIGLSPNITDFSNSQHDHANATGGGVIVESSAGVKGAVIVAGGEGVDISYSSGTATVAGENASDTNKGIAKFNSTDFANSSGDISLKNKTSYLSINGTGFVPQNPDVADINYAGDSGVEVSAGSVVFLANVNLPHGAVVTGVTVYGDNNTDTWTLRRYQRDQTVVVMATAVFNTQDTTITSATIDNDLYSYVLDTSAIADNVQSAEIVYTTDYD